MRRLAVALAVVVTVSALIWGAISVVRNIAASAAENRITRVDCNTVLAVRSGAGVDFLVFKGWNDEYFQISVPLPSKLKGGDRVGVVWWSNGNKEVGSSSFCGHGEFWGIRIK